MGSGSEAAAASVGGHPKPLHSFGRSRLMHICALLNQRQSLIEEIRPGDVVWFSPGEKHWHGASPTTAMTHIAIQESLDAKDVEWMEHVTDEQYGAGG